MPRTVYFGWICTWKWAVMATRWLSPFSGVARACVHAHMIFTTVSKRHEVSYVKQCTQNLHLNLKYLVHYLVDSIKWKICFHIQIRLLNTKKLACFRNTFKIHQEFKFTTKYYANAWKPIIRNNISLSLQSRYILFLE